MIEALQSCGYSVEMRNLISRQGLSAYTTSQAYVCSVREHSIFAVDPVGHRYCEPELCGSSWVGLRKYGVKQMTACWRLCRPHLASGRLQPMQLVTLSALGLTPEPP